MASPRFLLLQEDPQGTLGEEERDIMAKYGSGTDDVQ